MKTTKLVKGSVCAAIGLLSTVAVAASGWTDPDLVTRVSTGYSDGKVYVDGLSNTAECADALIEFSATDADTDHIQSVALAALLAGKDLECYVGGCSGNYQRGYRCRILQ